MKKPASKIRQQIVRLQEQLKEAETRDAERIGRIAVKAGLAEAEIDEADLLTAFEDLGRRFRRGEIAHQRGGITLASPGVHGAAPVTPQSIASTSGEG